MPRVKTITDEDALERALEFLMEHGPQQFTLARVGRAVGLSAPTLIQRFGSKQILLERVLELATRRAESAAATPSGDRDPRAALLDWWGEAGSAFRSPEHVAGNLAMLIEDLVDERRRSLALRHIDALELKTRALLEQMGSPDPSAHARIIEAQWNGLVIQWALRGEGPLDAWVTLGLERLLDELALSWSVRPKESTT